MVGPPAAGFKFNTFQEIKSHSSVLYNERMAILFYLLDMKSIGLNANYDIGAMLEVRSILKQIYKNTRMLIRNNPVIRSTLNLNTKDEGTYTTDLAFGMVDRMIESCENENYTKRKIMFIIDNLNNIEIMIKDVLQYFHYFIRPDFMQKPDVEMATEQYKQIADKMTVEELKRVAGKNNLIDFESLGSSRIELQEAVEDKEEDEDLKDLGKGNEQSKEEYYEK